MTAQHTSDYPTLGEVLRLPAFAGCIVCGGAAGLDRQVSGVNLTDTPDYARWLAQGELLITTGFAIADDPQAVDALLPTAMEKGLSGVGIKPGRYLPKPLSAELTEAADRLELPLLQLPDDVRFAELADTVSREIARRRIPTEQERQMALLLHHLVSGAPPSEAMERQAAESGIHLEYPHILLRIRADAPELQRRAWLHETEDHCRMLGADVCGILVAGADPLIHDNVQRHHLPAQIPGHVVGHGLAHTYEHAGGAKLVAVVVDITGLDRGQIGDEQPCSRRR